MVSAASAAVCVCLQKTFEARSQAVGAGKGWTQGVAMLTASAVARSRHLQTKAQQGRSTEVIEKLLRIRI
jgi:hypothetical protein